ncbi:hypothetical protein [Riemerella columbina]|uniref:hypothetical protein n=1 Tax=Riemerella columbina TaxID=103810 RepID=UPI00036A3819|nr:hypothetical protein [Riemerella columbina]
MENKKISCKKGYTSIVVDYQSPYSQEEIWDFLVHPKYAVEFTKSPCYYTEIGEDFELKKGNKWMEIHTGEDCKGEVVSNKITKITPFNYFQIVRHQSGVKNIITKILTQNEKGTNITEKHSFSISFKDFKWKHLVYWLFLYSGIFAKIAVDLEGDEYWFQKMEEKIRDTFYK